ncbi:hypothetical protein CBW65_01410 [Tumebacillus avium]|uniref:Nudix hydrolase domain-containing protein n=1 Tax=Tumebacillus avium TaxID=1903704 RepID=A0A1Y0IHU4_9BACL|nr:NUDIX domain-containing protein [Tumebacillus avium]ARU59860.1 hypothetical protein CBW65_01410 [Tumebacillus avium]
MKLIKELYETEILETPAEQTQEPLRCFVRKASRAILYNDQGQIALLFVSKDHYHKLPGGGIEGNEDATQALRREVLEEVGATIIGIEELGLTIEYRDQQNMLQISYSFTAKVDGALRLPDYTDEEIESGFTLKWVTPSEALHLLKSDQPAIYAGKFIRSRDLSILEAHVWGMSRNRKAGVAR